MKILRHTPDHAHILINTHILSPPYPPQCVGRDSKFAYNRHSIGICYEGGLDVHGSPADTRTPEQRASLKLLVHQLLKTFPGSRVCGHRDLSPDRNGNGEIEPEEWIKACPCFEVKDEFSGKK